MAQEKFGKGGFAAIEFPVVQKPDDFVADFPVIFRSFPGLFKGDRRALNLEHSLGLFPGGITDPANFRELFFESYGRDQSFEVELDLQMCYSFLMLPAFGLNPPRTVVKMSLAQPATAQADRAEAFRAAVSGFPLSQGSKDRFILIEGV